MESSRNTDAIGETADDLSALAWVHDELRRSLDAAHKALRRFVKEAEALTGSLTRRPAGMLRVNAPVAFSLQLIMPHLHEYASRYPQVSVDLWLSDRVVDLAEEGYDVAIRIARAPDEHLVVRKLSTRSLTAAVTVMVPNSLGPGELLMRFGTSEQQLADHPGVAGRGPQRRQDLHLAGAWGQSCMGTHR